MSADLAYAGQELDLFAEARRWKGYWSSLLRPWLRGDVLEVGAGIGANTGRLLRVPAVRRWICLEPDAALVARLEEGMRSSPLAGVTEIRQGTVADLPADSCFDAILYIDVLEHIEADRRELALAAARLKPGGALAVLAPAHTWLYSAFDAAIGHHRRYTRRSLAAAAPADLQCERLVYLDAAGLMASAANRWLLRSALPSRSQVLVWDRALVPLSRVLDPLLGHRVGKSVLGVWRAATP